MPRWFTKPTTKSPKGAASGAQSFEVGCHCGHIVSGVRERRHQAISCEECGDVVFVLPADVYPPLKSPATAKSNRKSATAKKRERPGKRSQATDAALAPSEEAAEPIFEEDEIATEAPEKNEAVPAAMVVLPSSETRRKLITPFRIVMAVTVVFVSLTVWWGLRVRALDQAARTAQTERKAADAALAAGDLDKAAGHYELACNALQVLGRNDDSAREACRLAQETKAGANLTLHPLLRIIEEAHGSLSAAKTEEEREYAEAHALDLYADKWIVMETRLISAAGDNAGGRWVLDYPLMVGSTVVEIEADLPVFSALQLQSQPQRVLFAAQLAKCRLLKDPKPRLVISFDPESAFLWTNSETLQKIGLLVGDQEADAETVALLDRQLRLMEDSP